jgi:chaperone protein EcpD
MTNVNRVGCRGLLAIAGLFSVSSEAEVVIRGTRVVYPAESKEVTMHLSNRGDGPGLVQVWLDGGDPDMSPAEAKVPFTVTPPLFRIEAKKGHAVRLIYTGTPLPVDRESLFWVNVLEVPPREEQDPERNLMQFAVRTRIKLMFRPAGLSTSDAFNAPKQLRWTLRTDEGDKTSVLRVKNPTPYYVNFDSIVAKVAEREISSISGGLVEPGGVADFSMDKLVERASGELKVHFKAITDLGVLVPYTQPLSP